MINKINLNHSCKTSTKSSRSCSLMLYLNFYAPLRSLASGIKQATWCLKQRSKAKQKWNWNAEYKSVKLQHSAWFLDGLIWLKPMQQMCFTFFHILYFLNFRHVLPGSRPTLNLWHGYVLKLCKSLHSGFNANSILLSGPIVSNPCLQACLPYWFHSKHQHKDYD